MMAVMVMLYTTVLSTNMKNADGWSGHGGGEAEGQWIKYFNFIRIYFLLSISPISLLTIPHRMRAQEAQPSLP